MNDLLSEVPWAVVTPILIFQLILMLLALVSLSREEKTNGPKLMWVFIIIFINIIGPVLYFVIGRRND